MSFFSLSCCINISKQIIENPSTIIDSSLNIPIFSDILDISGIINNYSDIITDITTDITTDISGIINNYSDITTDISGIINKETIF